MKLLVRIGRVATEPWPHNVWGATLAQALADRGHQIAVPADPNDPLPTGLTPIARREAEASAFDARVSFRPGTPEEIWLPLSESAVEALHPRGVRRPRRLLGEPEPRPLPFTLRRVRTALAFDEAHAGRLVARHAALRGRVLTVGWAPSAEPRTADRATARAALGLPDEALALVYLGGRRAGSIERTLLHTLEASLDDAGRRAVLLTVTPSSLASRLKAIRAGCAASVRSLGPTRRLDDLLVAADATIALGAPRDLHIGDFLAASLRAGTPALASRTAPGSGALLPGARKGDAPGVVVDRIDLACLRRGLAELLAEPRLESCRRAAASPASIQSLDQLAARLERACAGEEPPAQPQADNAVLGRTGTRHAGARP